MLDFLSSTDVGKVVPAVEVEDDAGSESSEWELRERREREEEMEAEAETLGAGGEAGDREEPRCSFQPPVHGIGWRGVGEGE